jgi:large subunit ribosomal protein L11
VLLAILLGSAWIAGATFRADHTEQLYDTIRPATPVAAGIGDWAMAKKKEIVSQFKIQAPGGTATPAPPIGPALGANGVNPGQFIQQFNERTRKLNGKVVGVVITVYKDRSFEFEVKSPPAAVLIADAAGVAKGSGEPNKNKVGKITRDQLAAIAQEKMKETTGGSLEAVMRTLAGTARSMGVTVEGF